MKKKYSLIDVIGFFVIIFACVCVFLGAILTSHAFTLTIIGLLLLLVSMPFIALARHKEDKELCKAYEDMITKSKELKDNLSFDKCSEQANELQTIRNMVIHGLYSVSLKSGYGPEVFAKFKEEQNRLFDNYEKNQNALKERKKQKENDI